MTDQGWCITRQAYLNAIRESEERGARAENEACAQIIEEEGVTRSAARDRATAAGRTVVASHRQSDVETCERMAAAIRSRIVRAAREPERADA